ncbi:MAG TPA: tRNA (adenosine(37)-N6)-dimethylallyltransferase MiaA [Negativicutes bacterium]|nr:tRNA (adenosine(37)-N6)-dimethylallyltransferase MiaA [Negativicutes bacterium]
MNRLIVIVGPTASGKSALAMRLALRFGCEIISGDSMCVYRGMDIGTAKPSQEERQQIPHHLIDIREPGEDFSVADFQQLAGEAVKSINQRGKIPILVGGTGLYVQALLEGYKFSSTPKTELRDSLTENATHESLAIMDPKTAARIHPNDRKRILRALEVATSEQRPISCDKTSNNPTLLFDCIVFGLSVERQELYRRINARVDKMLEAGLMNEVRLLTNRGLSDESTALQAIGYKEIAAHLQGLVPLADAIDHVKQSSRRYAKRQLTWFRRMPYIQWIEQDEDEAFNFMERQVAEKFVIK